MLDQLSALGWDQDQFLRFLDLGGPVVVILLGMSAFALAVILTKLAHFSGLRIGQQRGVEKALSLYRAGRTRDAIRRAERSPNPAAQMLARGLNGVQRGLPQDTIREEMIRYGNAALQDLRSGLRPLEVIGSLAPLLGLFGTVVGMIKAFQALEKAGAQVDVTVLSGGIWEALLTTAVGLAVAIPVVAVLNWLEGRVERIGHRMDDLVTRLFTEELFTGSVRANADDDDAPRLGSDARAPG
ncbi:MotA/TolQ/ExbB proton channel family protein [Thioalkalivibrio nitratireducens DSM 14787]|uniref:MotA/TolQ/ExbB proton channel family protein n=1 Tax=Thioalkalivibrio nitratireducens (strain DSM 14787 / UNIQEM 213 / ALEN2) TaxID=1255043 RepID=L0E2W5_THIND|nr:MotA/TolQ/ExbB proton channel family protein [Thioalkalivibrio nitratireducens]AGA34971.1 MotA/TolQ/ExbB proton channel family protein [Thioalkalivibrio nitratireducens DSM 14787]